MKERWKPVRGGEAADTVAGSLPRGALVDERRPGRWKSQPLTRRRWKRIWRSRPTPSGPGPWVAFAGALALAGVDKLPARERRWGIAIVTEDVRGRIATSSGGRIKLPAGGAAGGAVDHSTRQDRAAPDRHHRLTPRRPRWRSKAIRPKPEGRRQATLCPMAPAGRASGFVTDRASGPDHRGERESDNSMGARVGDRLQTSGRRIFSVHRPSRRGARAVVRGYGAG